MFVIVTSTCLHAQEMSSDYKIYDVKKQKLISIDDIVADMGQADVLFFGEDHNDSVGHYLKQHFSENSIQNIH